MDIPTCSYVVRYEFVSDEIGTIQSRGRARAQDSAYYLITEKDSVNHKREKNNKFREDDMDQAIEKWPTIDKPSFERSLTEKTVNMEYSTNSMIDVFSPRTILSKHGKKN